MRERKSPGRSGCQQASEGREGASVSWLGQEGPPRTRGERWTDSARGEGSRKGREVRTRSCTDAGGVLSSRGRDGEQEMTGGTENCKEAETQSETGARGKGERPQEQRG